MLLRDRFHHAPRTARVVWLPRARDEITWFEVFALEADTVWEKSLIQGLREYGVGIPRDQEADLVSLLPAHAREWFDKPYLETRGLMSRSAAIAAMHRPEDKDHWSAARRRRCTTGAPRPDR